MKKTVIMLALFCALGWQTVQGQTNQELKSSIDELQKEVDQLKTPSPSEFALPDGLKWLEQVKIYGDLRLRYEGVQAQGANHRDRGRYRGRIGIKADINDQWAVDFRLATGGSSPTSTNQTMGNGFTTKDIGFDRGFVTYKPVDIKGLSVMAGKMSIPFHIPSGSSIIWDSDVTPEGLALRYSHKVDDKLSLFTNAAGFWAMESGNDADTAMWAGQVGGSYKIDSNNEIIAGSSLYQYGNLEGRRLGTLGMNGNTADINGNYANDFQMFEIFAEYKTNINGMPISLIGDYVQNLKASSKDTGWLAGLRINRASKPGDWQLDYNYRELQADAVLGAITDSDFIGGGTNGTGHRISGKYMLAKNVETALTYFHNERGNDDNNYKAWQLDLVVKF